MNFQQLRYVRETVRRGLNLTDAAAALHTSQPGVSRQIKELEEELGVVIFERRGKRFVGLTEPGQAIVVAIDRVLREAENLRAIGQEFASRDAGSLTVAATHTQARYVLPRVVQAFKRKLPAVQLALLQGNPTELAELVIAGTADIAIATEALAGYEDLLTLPAYSWHHCVVVPDKHPLARQAGLQLEHLAAHPIITYSPAFTGRARIDEAFAARGLAPNIVFTATDSDVIKTYVELGMGIGIIAEMAFNARRDAPLRALKADHFFRTNTTRIAVKRGRFLRRYAYDFIELFAPALDRTAIERAHAGGGASYEL